MLLNFFLLGDKRLSKEEIVDLFLFSDFDGNQKIPKTNTQRYSPTAQASKNMGRTMTRALTSKSVGGKSSSVVKVCEIFRNIFNCNFINVKLN